MTFVIARTLGAADVGHYALALSTMTTTTFIALMGLDQLTVRTIAGDLGENRADLASATLRQAKNRVILTGGVAGILIVLATPLWERIALPASFVLPTAAVVVVFPLFRVVYAALRASGRLVFSQLFDGPTYTGATAIVAIIVYASRAQLSAQGFAWVYSIAMYVSLAIAWYALAAISRSWPQANEPRFPALINHSWRIFLTAWANVIADWVILAIIGAYADSEAVGAYRVAFQIISVLLLMVATVENIVGPGLAKDLRLNQVATAKRRHRRATMMMAAVVGIPSVVAIIFAAPMLRMFGPEFEQAQTALRILLAAQLINVCTGPVGAFLFMAGRERFSMIFSYAALVASVVVGFVAIPRFGATGGALAYLSAIAIRNIGAYVVFLLIQDPLPSAR